MMRIFLFFMQAGALIGLSLWLANRPGKVLISWQGYEINTHIGFIVAAVLALLFLISLVIWLVRRFEGLRDWLSNFIHFGRRRRGLYAFLRAKSALKAGDYLEAHRQLLKAEKRLEPRALYLWLAAEVSMAQKDYAQASVYFKEMQQVPEMLFLSTKGQEEIALKLGAYGEALEYSRQVLHMFPKGRNTLLSSFDLEFKAGNFESALKVLHTMRKYKILEENLLSIKEADVYYKQGCDLELSPENAVSLFAKAYQINPSSLKFILKYAALLRSLGKKKKALTLLEEAWGKVPSPEIRNEYFAFFPEMSPLEKLGALKDLTRLSPKHPETYFAYATLSLEAHLWGEAKRYLAEVSEAKELQARVHILQAQLAEQEYGDYKSAYNLLLKAMTEGEEMSPSASPIKTQEGKEQPLSKELPAKE